MAYYFSCDKQKCHVSVTVLFFFSFSFLIFVFPAWSLNIYELVCVVNMVRSNIPKYLKWNSTKLSGKNKRLSSAPLPREVTLISPDWLEGGFVPLKLRLWAPWWDCHVRLFFFFSLLKMNCNFWLFHLYPSEVAVSLFESIWGNVAFTALKSSLDLSLTVFFSCPLLTEISYFFALFPSSSV